MDAVGASSGSIVGLLLFVVFLVLAVLVATYTLGLIPRIPGQRDREADEHRDDDHKPPLV